MNSLVVWILIADSYEALLYSTEKLSGNWSLIKKFIHPEAREADVDLVSDRSGNYRNPMSPGSSAFDEHTDPKQVEIDNFAHTLGDCLNQGRSVNAYGKLIIVAPPRFHGILQKHCNPHTKDLIIKHLEKDYTRKSEREIKDLVLQHLGGE